MLLRKQNIGARASRLSRKEHRRDKGAVDGASVLSAALVTLSRLAPGDSTLIRFAPPDGSLDTAWPSRKARNFWHDSIVRASPRIRSSGGVHGACSEKTPFVNLRADQAALIALLTRWPTLDLAVEASPSGGDRGWG